MGILARVGLFPGARRLVQMANFVKRGITRMAGGKVDAGRPPIPRDVGPGVTMDAAAPGGEDAALQGPDGPIEPDDAQVEDVGAPPSEDAALPETDVKPSAQLFAEPCAFRTCAASSRTIPRRPRATDRTTRGSQSTSRQCAREASSSTACKRNGSLALATRSPSAPRAPTSARSPWRPTPPSRRSLRRESVAEHRLRAAAAIVGRALRQRSVAPGLATGPEAAEQLRDGGVEAPLAEADLLHR
jgi:hypothetical protein